MVQIQRLTHTNQMRQAPLKKQPQAGAPLFGRTAEAFPDLDTFRPEPKKKKKSKRVIVQKFYNGVPDPNEKSGLLSTCRKAAQDTVQTVKNIAVLAGMAGGGYMLYKASGPVRWTGSTIFSLLERCSSGFSTLSKFVKVIGHYHEPIV